MKLILIYGGEKAKETGILIDKPKCEKPETVHTHENIAAVTESVCEAPSTSIHRRSQQLNISEHHSDEFCIKSLVWSKVQLVQELKPIEHSMRFRFAKWACDRLTKDADFGKKNIISDEAHFDFGEYVNKQYWKADTPKTSHCLERILVQRNNWAIFLRKWANFCSQKLKRQRLVSTGPIYVPHSHFSYQAMLNEFLFTKIEDKDIGNIWFQQDGTTYCFRRSHYHHHHYHSSKIRTQFSHTFCNITMIFKVMS